MPVSICLRKSLKKFYVFLQAPAAKATVWMSIQDQFAQHPQIKRLFPTSRGTSTDIEPVPAWIWHIMAFLQGRKSALRDKMPMEPMTQWSALSMSRVCGISL